MESNNPLPVLTFIDWYSPAYKGGGPIRSVLNLAALLREDVRFHVVCGNKEIDGTPLDVPLQVWTDGTYNEKTYYCKRPTLRILQILHRNERFACIHLNGIYSFSFSILPLFLHLLFFKNVRIIVSPRGMLNPGALQIKSTKKHFFIKMARFCRLYSKVEWHATSEEEASHIQHFFKPKKKIHILSNIPVPPRDLAPLITKDKGELRMYSSTRIVPIKQLEIVLKALSNIDCRSFKISFHLYGPIEDEAYAQLLSSMANQIEGLDFAIKGPYSPTALSEATQNYHLFCLPSANENFGHAIYEAFSNACPVLISDQTPWHQLAESKAGFDLPSEDIEGFANQIKTYIEMDLHAWQKWQQGALSFAKSHYKREEWVKGYLTLFATNANN